MTKLTFALLAGAQLQEPATGLVLVFSTEEPKSELGSHIGYLKLKDSCIIHWEECYTRGSLRKDV